MRGLGTIFGGGLPRLPVLEQRQRDVLGLALLAWGCSWASSSTRGSPAPGGRAGHALRSRSGWTLGRARVLAPLALVIGGGALLLRPGAAGGAAAAHRRGVPVRGRHARARGRARSVCRPAPGSGEPWSSEHLQTHGGLLGEALFRLVDPLVQGLGIAAILVVFLVLAGIVLLTGASLAALLRATGHGLRDTTRIVRRIGAAPKAGGAGPRRELLRDLGAEGSLRPPEPDAG